MPTYSYRCNQCDKTFDKFKAISARREPTEQPCPECGGQGTVTILIGAPSLNAEIGGSLNKAGDGWKDVLSKVKSNHRHNTIRD